MADDSTASAIWSETTCATTVGHRTKISGREDPFTYPNLFSQDGAKAENESSESANS